MALAVCGAVVPSPLGPRCGWSDRSRVRRAGSPGVQFRDLVRLLPRRWVASFSWQCRSALISSVDHSAVWLQFGRLNLTMALLSAQISSVQSSLASTGGPAGVTDGWFTPAWSVHPVAVAPSGLSLTSASPCAVCSPCLTRLRVWVWVRCPGGGSVPGGSLAAYLRLACQQLL